MILLVASMTHDQYTTQKGHLDNLSYNISQPKDCETMYDQHIEAKLQCEFTQDIYALINRQDPAIINRIKPDYNVPESITGLKLAILQRIEALHSLMDGFNEAGSTILSKTSEPAYLKYDADNTALLDYMDYAYINSMFDNTIVTGDPRDTLVNNMMSGGKFILYFASILLCVIVIYFSVWQDTKTPTPPKLYPTALCVVMFASFLNDVLFYHARQTILLFM